MSMQDQQRLMQEQGEQRIHESNLRSAMAEEDSPDAEYLRTLNESSLEATVSVLDNLLSQDWILGNIDEAEYNEVRWLTRLAYKKVLHMHPDQDCGFVGRHRAFAFNDEWEHLEPLTEQEKLEIETYIEAYIKGRASRAKGGWQQEKNTETVSVSKVENGKKSEDKFLQGLFS